MWMMVRLAVTIACCAIACTGYAQTATRSTDSAGTFSNKAAEAAAAYNLQKRKGPKPIRHELSVGVRLNSDRGGGIYFDLGKVKGKNMRQLDMFHNVRFWQFEAIEKHSPKEYRISSFSADGTKYKYGKINNMYTLKLGYGYRKMLAGKPDPGTVSIHWSNVVGVAIGFVKPYYLHVYSDPNAIKYSETTQNDFLNQELIEGNAGFGKGLSEVQVVPGGHFKSALHFDFATNRKSVFGVETGFNIEYYSSEIKMMANQPGTSYFFDIFVGIQFGKRW